MRIAYVANSKIPSREANSVNVMKMCYAFSELGHNVELVIPSHRGDAVGVDPYSYYAVKPVFKIKILPGADGAMRPGVHAFLSSIYTGVKRNSFDLVITRNIYYAFLSTRLRIPTIYDAHHPPKNKAAYFSFKSIADSDYLIRFTTNSQALARMYLELGLPKKKWAVAPNGVDLEKFEPPLSKEEARLKAGLPLHAKIVCYSGHLYSGRGVDLLIEASLELEDILFVVIGGTKEDIEMYREMAQAKGAKNFILRGFVPHETVPAYLFSADVLVVPYTSGITDVVGRVQSEFTSPIKMFEYMASRRPIVATRLPYVEEILEDGKNAILVESDSVGALISGIKKALNEPELYEKLAGDAASQVKKYTWKDRAVKLLDGVEK